MRVNKMVILCALCMPLLAAVGDDSVGVDMNADRAKFNYQMSCQGCHGPDGAGHKSVPELKDSMHRFMSTQRGREYLVRVPGSANSVLNDANLAEVLNWMLGEFTTSETERGWRPFVAQEVAEYRKDPLLETIEYRRNLLESISQESHHEKIN